MRSDNPANIPEIDLSELKAATPEWESASSQVWKAMEEYGCFRAVFRKIPLKLQNEILSELKELFDLPLETKLKFNDDVCESPFGGYIGNSPFTPLYESVGFEDSFSFEMAEKMIKALLPHGNPDFSKNIHEFTKQISELENIVVRMITESLGIHKYLDEHLNSVSHSLRFQKYDLPQIAEGEIGLHTHKDKGVMAILYQNQVDGLEIETRDGKWINCRPSPDNFVVLFGESLHAWTNGRTYAPDHRVTLRGNILRYSVGMFTTFKKGYIVKAPEELVDEEHPLLYKPFDFAEVLQVEQRDAVENYQTTLKPYVPLIAYYGTHV